MAAQGSGALMEDSHSNSLVFCHDLSAQILEFSRRAARERIYRALLSGDEIAERRMLSGSSSLSAEEGRN